MRVRLTNKEVQDGTNCPWCNMEPETPEHVLLQCIKSSKTCSAVKGDKFCMESGPKLFTNACKIN